MVEKVLAACRKSSSDGSRLLWNLGAEKLKRMVGDEGHLQRLLGNELFSPLIGFERVDKQPLERIENAARQAVTVFPPDGGSARFLISLKQMAHGDRAGEWLITGLEREW